MLRRNFRGLDRCQFGIAQLDGGEGVTLALLEVVEGLGRDDVDRLPAVPRHPHGLAGQGTVVIGAEVLLHLGRRCRDRHGRFSATSVTYAATIRAATAGDPSERPPCTPRPPWYRGGHP